MGERNVRLTSGLRPVSPRDDSRSSFLAAEKWTDAYLSLLNIFIQGMARKFMRLILNSGTNSILWPDISKQAAKQKKQGIS